jgi:N-acetylglucosaminyldiphosphoundecaprenol N-acetyl-beta-D-mannosaminyltransferase
VTEAPAKKKLTVVPCAGVPITACTPAEAAQEVIRLATSDLDRGVDVHLCNAYTLALADKDPEFKAVLKNASINFPDGKSVVWANKLLHRDRNLPSDRVYGPNLLLEVFALGQDVGLPHFLLGSTPGLLAKLEAELRRRFPAIEIVGLDSPPFRPLADDERERQRERILASGAKIVWVGLGTPKQDSETARLRGDVPLVFVAVGAAFDFVAGNKKQAPRWMQRSGLEWVFRLASEPRRLWRRYLFGNARFVLAAARRSRG